MATIEQLEKSILWRVVKVIYIFALLLVGGVTTAIFWSETTTVYDASEAYAVCDSSQSVRIPLDQLEKQAIENHYSGQLSMADGFRIAQKCYGITNPGATLEFTDLYSDRLFDDQYSYSIYEVEETEERDWDMFLWALFIEFLIFAGVRFAGLYIFGGKEALV